MANNDKSNNLIIFILIFLLGLIIGVLIMTFIMYITYSQRLFIYSFCPIEKPKCKGSDFILSDEKALEMGYKKNRIYSIKDGNLYYHPVLLNNDCSLTNNEATPILIEYPKYCKFITSNGNSISGESLYSGSNKYKLDNGELIDTYQSCSPINSYKYKSGYVEKF